VLATVGMELQLFNCSLKKKRLRHEDEGNAAIREYEFRILLSLGVVGISPTEGFFFLI